MEWDGGENFEWATRTTPTDRPAVESASTHAAADRRVNGNAAAVERRRTKGICPKIPTEFTYINLVCTLYSSYTESIHQRDRF